MGESSTSIKTIIINFGIILGLTSVVFQLMLYFFDMHYKNDTTAGIISLIIMIGILITALFTIKKLMKVYFLSEALKIGLGISLVSAIISIIYTQILINFWIETMNKSLDLTIENMRIQNPEMPKEALESVRSIQKKMSSPLIFSAIQIIFALFLDLLYH